MVKSILYSDFNIDPHRVADICEQLKININKTEQSLNRSDGNIKFRNWEKGEPVVYLANYKPSHLILIIIESTTHNIKAMLALSAITQFVLNKASWIGLVFIKRET